MTLEQIFNDAEFAYLLEVDNAEDYKGWFIYEKDYCIIANRRASNGIEVLSVAGTGDLYRQAIKLKIDALGAA